MENRTNSLAIASFVLSLLLFIPFTGIVGFVLGIIALGQIRQTGEKGNGLAVTAVTLGAIFLGFWFLYIVGSAVS